jgi:PAS domain S-box-containing protein
MQQVSPDTTHLSNAGVELAKTLFRNSLNDIYQRTDRLFARLMVFQWLAGIAAALCISPRTWIGATSTIHWHVWAAVFLGGAIAALPVFLTWKQPGHTLTRHVTAVSQMMTSALLIHLTGGRIETHFHVFGSLAFLAFYRDWRVIITATVVVTADHIGRGLFWPQSVFGVLAASEWRWLEHAGWVVFEDTFLLISIRHSLREMTEVAFRRAKLEGLNAELKYVKAAMDEHAIVAFTDTQGIITFVNDKFCAISKYSRQELLGQDHRIINSGYHSKEFIRYLWTTIANGYVWKGELKNRAKDGTFYWVDTTIVPFLDKNGKPTQYVSIRTDITVRKQAEEALLEARATLEKRVEERTSELVATNRELVEASREAGMAEIATGVLHNVGNVLNSVNVASSCVASNLRKSKTATLSKVVDLLREHKSDLGVFLTRDSKGKQLPEFLAQLTEHLIGEQEIALKELGQLQKNIEHIRDIVTMQQSYAKLSGGAETLKVTDLVEEALKINGSDFARDDIQVKKELDQELTVTIHKNRVLQIMINLLRNARQACDASGQDSKRLVIHASNGGDRIRIAVSDNGIGISAENMSRLFVRGFTTKKEGHGFGLHSGALSAREMGGALTAQSDGPGKGATFILELPKKPVYTVEEPAAAPESGT